MRRYGLLLLVLVLAVTSLLAAAAYNTATVTNAATLTVKATDDSLLALSPKKIGNPYGWHTMYIGPGNKDETCWIKDGQLCFDFSKGLGSYASDTPPTGYVHGVQPNSEYIWDYLFLVRNKTSETIQVSIAASFGGLPAGVHVYMQGTNNSGGTNSGWKEVSAAEQIIMNVQPRMPGDLDEVYVSVKIVIDSTVLPAVFGTFNGTVVVKGTAL